MLAFYLGVVTWLSWPLLAHLATRLPCSTILTCGFDPIYVIWALSWETHALGSSPSHLFDANIYHPSPSALLYGPTALGALPYFGPTFALTGNPILAINLLFLLAIAATALTLHVVASAWTGADTVGFVAASVFLSNEWIWRWVPTAPHYAVLLYFPLIIFLAAKSSSARRAVFLVGLVVLQSLTEPVYIAPAVFGPLAVLALGRLGRPRTAASGGGLLVVLLASALLLLPIYAVYNGVRVANPALLEQTVWKYHQLTPLLYPVTLSAAGLRGNGTTDAWWPLLGLIFVGAVATLAQPPTREVRTAWVHSTLWTVVGLLLSTRILVVFDRARLELPHFALFTGAFPTLAAIIRIPSRIGVAALAGLALLGGLAVHACGDAVTRFTSPRLAPAVRALLAAFVALALYSHLNAAVPEFNTWAGPEVESPALEAVRHGRGALLELPVGDNGHPESHVDAMFRSIFHWRPLLNGYSSYFPAGFPDRMALARQLPERTALSALARDTGLSAVLVHLHSIPVESRARWLVLAESGRDDLRLTASDPGHLLFELRRSRSTQSPDRPLPDRDVPDGGNSHSYDCRVGMSPRSVEWSHMKPNWPAPMVRPKRLGRGRVSASPR